MNSNPLPRRSAMLQPNQGPSPAELLAKMPRKPMTTEQQLAALDKVQAQATQRIKLGQQLFKAAEARLTQHQEVLEKIRNQQQDLREQVQEDVAKSLQTYDQWMGKIDESFTTAIRELTDRLDRLEADQHNAREEMQSMVSRATALMEQTQQLLMEAFDDEVIREQPAAAIADHPETSISNEPNELESAMIQAFLPDDEEPEQANLSIAETETNTDAPPPHHEDEEPSDDVFGQVLQRLRDAEDQDPDQAAA